MKRPLKRGLLLAILAIAVFIPLSRGAWDYANDKSDWFEIGVDSDYLNPGYINSTNGTTVTTNPTKPNNTNTTPNTTTPNTTTPNTTTPNTTQPNTTTPNTTTPNTTTPNTTQPNTTTPNTTTPNTTTPNTTTSTPSNFLTSSGWNYTKDKSDWFEMGSDADYLTPGSINGTTGGTTTPNTTTPNTTTPNTTQPNTTTPNTTTPNTTQPNTTQPNNTGGNNNTWYWNYSTDTSDWFDLGNDSNSNIQGNVNQTAQNSGGGTTTPNTTTPNTTKPNNTNTTTPNTTTPNTTQPNNTGGTGGNNNTWYWNFSTDTSDWFDLGNDTYSNIIGNVNETAKTTGPTSNQLNQSTNTSSGGTTNTSSGGTTNTSSGGTTTQNTTKNPNNNSTYWNWATDTSERFDLGSDSDALGVTGAASTTSPNYGADQFDLSDATDLNDGVDLTDPAGLGAGFQASGPNNTLPIGNSGRTLGAGAIVLLFSVAVNALLA